MPEENTPADRRAQVRQRRLVLALEQFGPGYHHITGDGVRYAAEAVRATPQEWALFQPADQVRVVQFASHRDTPPTTSGTSPSKAVTEAGESTWSRGRGFRLPGRDTVN